MNLQFSTSGVANFIEGDLEDASFKLNRVKLEILGSFSKQFSYHFRQSFNKYEGGNLAASKIRNLECPSYEICLIDYGCGKFNRKIHIMEQYP